MVARHHTDDALRLLEKYQGDYEAETLEWRQAQAQLIRGQVAAEATAPKEVTPPVPAAVPVPPPVRPRPAAITEDEGVLRVSRFLLKENLDIASRQAADIASRHAAWDAHGNFGRLQRLLEQAHATELAVMDTFAAENGREISIALLKQGVVKGTVGEVESGHVHLTLASGADRSVTADDLDVTERLKRLNRTGDTSSGATLLKALWAYHAHAVDRAKTLFYSLPDPFGATFVRVVDERP